MVILFFDVLDISLVGDSLVVVKRVTDTDDCDGEDGDDDDVLDSWFFGISKVLGKVAFAVDVEGGERNANGLGSELFVVVLNCVFPKLNLFGTSLNSSSIKSAFKLLFKPPNRLSISIILISEIWKENSMKL